MVERDLAKVDVAGSIPVSCSKQTAETQIICRNGSVVERDLAKVDVAGSIPVSCSKI